MTPFRDARLLESLILRYLPLSLCEPEVMSRVERDLADLLLGGEMYQEDFALKIEDAIRGNT